MLYGMCYSRKLGVESIYKVGISSCSGERKGFRIVYTRRGGFAVPYRRYPIPRDSRNSGYSTRRKLAGFPLFWGAGDQERVAMV